MQPKSIAHDFIHLDEVKIVEDTRCCLKVQAVITKEGVYEYPDGRAFKSAAELLKATKTARAAKITILEHPETLVVMSQAQMKGIVEKPFFERNRIKAVLSFWKADCPAEFLKDVRAGNLKDVSIGFYYRPDFKKGAWNGQGYDYLMRDIVIDHVAAGVPRGRCTYPSCGIGVDAFQTDKVVKRGGQWCVVHCHPDGTPGKSIKCYPGTPEGKARAEAMHRAIQARKAKSILDFMVTEGESMIDYAKIPEMDLQTLKELFGADAEKPPKDWWDNCESKAKSFATDPAKFCGWLWAHGTEDPKWSKIRQSFGQSSIGRRMKMSTETEEECVRKRMAENPELTKEQALALCKAETEPGDQPTPPGGTLDAEQQSEYQKCMSEQMQAGKSMVEAAEFCKTKTGKTDQDAAFENCVERLMKEGKSREEAEKQCRAEHPIGEGDQEGEKTPLERCIENKMDEGMSEADAREWCKAELAGEHEKTDELIEKSRKSLELKAELDAERRRHKRTIP